MISSYRIPNDLLKLKFSFKNSKYVMTLTCLLFDFFDRKLFFIQKRHYVEEKVDDQSSNTIEKS